MTKLLAQTVPEPATRAVWERALLAGSLSPNARLVGLVLAVRSTPEGQVRQFSIAVLAAVANLPSQDIHQALAELRANQRIVVNLNVRNMTQAYLSVPGPKPQERSPAPGMLFGEPTDGA